MAFTKLASPHRSRLTKSRAAPSLSRWMSWRRVFPKAARRAADEITEHDNAVILAGFGRFGHIVGRLLRANGFPTTVLDYDAEQVETLRQFGMKSFYGDATRLDLLHSAGADHARLFVLAIDDEAKALQIVKPVQRLSPWNMR